MSLKLRRGTNAERLAFTPAVGELIYTTDSKQLYAGDGTTAGGTLVSYEGSVGGAMGSDLVLSGFNITGSGNINIGGTITSTGNIVSGGTITATGDIIANGNIILGDSNTDNVTIGADVNSDIIPNVTDTFDLGSETQRWDTLHVNNVFGDLEGNVRANDSTILVDAQAGVLRGTLIGDLQGNVAGNVAGNVTGDTTGSVRAAGGQIVVNNGTDGTDAVFTGTFNGTLNGPVTNGVLTTDSYANPTWITSLDAGKLFGSMNGVIINGDITGIARGGYQTDDLEIFGNSINSIVTNQKLFINTQGSGTVNIPGTAEIGTLLINNNPLSGGIQTFSSSSTSRPLVIYSAFDGASSSTDLGASTIYARARNFVDAPVPITAGDEISTIVFSALIGSNPTTDFKEAANIKVKSISIIPDTAVEGQIEFSTTNSSGVTSTKLIVRSDGSLRVDSPTTITGTNTGEVNFVPGSSTPSTWLKINIGGVEYAIPAYALVS
jgi:hypothetical protein